MVTIIIYSFIFSIGLNLALGLVAYLLQTDKITDISYAMSFLIISIVGFSFSSKDQVDIAILMLITAWAIRLGYYLMSRIKLIGKDDRFDSFRGSLKGFLGFWFLQGLSIGVISICFLTLYSIDDKPMDAFAIFGIVVASIGLIIETVADYQKFKFKKQHPSKFMQTGLWSIIRHPNYLGEILFWFGIFIMGTSVFLNAYFIAIISPLWITLLLLKVSGIPLLEKQWKKKYNQNKAWKNYYNNSWKMIPYVW